MKYNSDHLQPVNVIAGVGPKIASLLQKKQIETVEDLLLTLPLRYEDRRIVTPIAEVVDGLRVTLKGSLKSIRTFGGRGRLRRTVGRLVDASGEIDVAWFGWAGTDLQKDQRILVTGDIRNYQQKMQVQNPEAYIFEDDKPISPVLPVYSETEGLRQRTWRKIFANASAKYLAEWEGGVPAEIRMRMNLLSIGEALEQIHLPNSDCDLEKLVDYHHGPVYNLLFEEMFVFQLGLAFKRNIDSCRNGIAFDLKKARLHELANSFPFSLTESQKKCARQIAEDMASSKPMHRLIHGDVGSGKTVLAVIAASIAASNGYQVAVMAPTEVLARQHAAQFTEYLEPLGIRVSLITGAITGRERRTLEERLTLGVDRVIIGTHALISGGVEFADLGLVIVDEQHKFGVEQRGNLIAKGATPDILVLSATPIPRSLALTIYGDLDVSKLSEKPGGTGRVTTTVIPQSERAHAYRLMTDMLRDSHQGYIVCPRLEVGEDDNIANVHSLADELMMGPLKDYRLGVLHGSMKSKLRQQVIDLFKEKRLDVLVATTVIEVGIDMPSATILIVENAEQFGLSQLHQLRGRIGRGDKESLCVFLYNDECSAEAKTRLDFLADCHDGFVVAEEDLKMRGPGELFGVRQHGVPPLRFAKYLLADTDLAESTRVEVQNLLQKDPHLQYPEHHWARMVVMQRWGSLIDEGGCG